VDAPEGLGEGVATAVLEEPAGDELDGLAGERAGALALAVELGVVAVGEGLPAGLELGCRRCM
jgi:hypothetical protein